MGNNVYSYVNALLDHAEANHLAEKADRIYYTNRLLELLQLDSFEEAPAAEGLSLQTVLDRLCDCAAEAGLIEDGVPVSNDTFLARNSLILKLKIEKQTDN